MEKEELKGKILDFIKSQRLTVISTVDTEHNKPEAAVIAFAEKDNLELIFGTADTSRKYKNLQSNKNVSFVIGWSDELGTIQYEGVAEELSGDVAQEHGRIQAEKNLNSGGFLTRDNQRWFLVRPIWIRWVDKSKKPQEVHEVKF